MMENGNYDFLSISIEAQDKSRIVVMPTSFGVGALRRMVAGSNDNGVIYTQVEFATNRCSGTVHDVFTPDFFYRLHHALTEFIHGKTCELSERGLDSFVGFELFRDEDCQIVCRVTMPDRLRNDTTQSPYHETSMYLNSMRTLVELELWLDTPMMQSMLADTEAMLRRIEELASE